MRLAPAALAAALALLAAAAPASAQETETPSSRPPPSPGAPRPPVSAPGEGPAASPAAPDRGAAQAAVRSQCVADRARFCKDATGVGALACLSARFGELSPDCQSAVTALKEARTERAGMPK